MLDGDHVAVVSEIGNLLVFPVSEMAELSRGKGTRLQRYRQGGLGDVRSLTLSTGLQWHDPAGRTRTESDLGKWMGKRGSAGRKTPRGFPKSNRFT